MRKYFLGWYEVIDGRIIIKYGDEINENVITEIAEKTEPISEFISSYVYFEMLLVNFREVKLFLEKYTADRKIKREAKQGMDYIFYFSGFNRLMINALNSIHTYLNHYELTLRNEGMTERYNYFKKTKSWYFDNEFLYRFLYHLRNYAVHYSFPIKNVKSTMKQKEMRFYIDRKDLLSCGYEWHKQVKKDLEEKTFDFDVGQIVEAAMVIFSKFQVEMAKKYIDTATEVLNFYKGFARIHQNELQYPIIIGAEGEGVHDVMDLIYPRATHLARILELLHSVAK